MTFAQKLRELRDAAGLSEKKLADASGVAFGALHFYGLGRRKPSFAAVVKIAKALGVTCEAFADCEDIATDEGAEKPAPAAQRELRAMGRPKKDRPAPAAPKRPRGRPRKGKG